MTAVHSAADDTLSVLDGDSALSFVDFNDHEDHSQCNDEKQEQLERGNGADLQIINNGGDSLREAGYDTAEDDQRDAIADSVFRNFFADPHQEAGASDEDDYNECKVQPAVVNKCIVDTEGVRHAECLNGCKEYSEVSCDLLYSLVTFLSVFSPLFESRNDGSQELHDNG